MVELSMRGSFDGVGSFVRIVGRVVSNVLYALTSARNSAIIFAGIVFIAYVVLPGWLGYAFNSPYMLPLAALGLVSAVCVVVGFYVPLVDAQFGRRRMALILDARMFHVAVWAAFAVFLIVAFSTAPSIPLLSAIKGGQSVVALDQERAAFLKTRQGWQVVLPYIGALFAGALLPYSLASLLRRQSWVRYGALGAFFLYAESFLQKALFLQVLIPIFYLVAQRRLWNLFAFCGLIVFTGALLFGNARLVQDTLPAFSNVSIDLAPAEPITPRQPTHAGPVGPQGTPVPTPTVNGPSAEQIQAIWNASALAGRVVPPVSAAAFFAATYIAKSSFEQLVWRAMAVPVFTARDALVVFDQVFEHKYLFGSTSSLLSSVFKLKRVNFDATVYAYEWGESNIGRSNAVYFAEGFVNFGWIGVVLYSLFIGQCFRAFYKSKDDGFKSMWPLFAYNVVQASLIGSLLSSGFLLVLFIGLFVDLKWRDPEPASGNRQRLQAGGLEGGGQGAHPA